MGIILKGVNAYTHQTFQVWYHLLFSNTLHSYLAHQIKTIYINVFRYLMKLWGTCQLEGKLTLHGNMQPASRNTEPYGHRLIYKVAPSA